MNAIGACLLLQNDSGGGLIGALFSGVFGLVMLAFAVIVIIGGWKMFEKAGQPGWGIIVPFYNAYLLLKIAGRPGWWLLLFLIPLVNLVISVIVAIDIAKSFGQSAVWGVVLLWLLCGIGYLILGFGSARYIGPAADPSRALAT
jgi:hypothetical protein